MIFRTFYFILKIYRTVDKRRQIKNTFSGERCAFLWRSPPASVITVLFHAHLYVPFGCNVSKVQYKTRMSIESSPNIAIWGCSARNVTQTAIFVQLTNHNEVSLDQAIKPKERLKTMKSHVLSLRAVTPFY